MGGVIYKLLRGMFFVILHQIKKTLSGMLKKWFCLGKKRRISVNNNGEVQGKYRYKGTYVYKLGCLNPELLGITDNESENGYADYTYDKEDDNVVLNGPFYFIKDDYANKFVVNGTYFKNKRVGQWNCSCKWNKEERVKVVLSFNNNGTLSGSFSIDRNGWLVEAFYDNGKLDGVVTIINKVLKVKFKSYFSKGLLKGSCFYEDEKYSFRGSFNDNGRADGVWKASDKIKAQKMETIYIDGLLHESTITSGRHKDKLLLDDKIADWWDKIQSFHFLPGFQAKPFLTKE